ncbi:hypothetical protein ORI20_21020 [Mycobacterium sp. CVI_P3]|uniref:Uncharacterized protein n=1 Tax=Mycobacterium pinniadriaticum TaxID=2994102 RepID=A0ABT3SI18_9MYCO|nr:hypothetical protein [Mycobacterium pinniadriaticum]MCX2932759.1 hypothetical protein [Mycobacterium pinniadriaticum]MCX2939181.1 hypothetical protein [Mycobacterium pinniadriaticum]
MTKILLSGLVASMGIGLAALFGGIAVASAASPSTSFAVQDGDSGADGALIDTDGTQGDFKAAVDGSMTGPLMVASPQDKAVP